MSLLGPTFLDLQLCNTHDEASTSNKILTASAGNPPHQDHSQLTKGPGNTKKTLEKTTKPKTHTKKTKFEQLLRPEGGAWEHQKNIGKTKETKNTKKYKV